MSAQRREINRITATMKERDEQLFSYPNVVGCGVGYKVKGGRKLNQLAIIVFVKKKLPLSNLQQHEIIPPTIEEILTDVQESEEIVAHAARTDKWRPAPPGVSIGHPLITAGTFGCVALKAGIRKILSNNHVLANSNIANIGDASYQPGPFDGGGPGDTIALLEDWIPIVFTAVANNLVDAAIAAPLDDADILNEILDLGLPTDVVEAELGMDLVKSGRTTAITYGTITAINATILVNYGAPGLARFVDQIITTNMSAGGDSGSLVLTHPEHKAVGLLFAGSASLTVSCRIQSVESLLGISILLEGDLTDASADLAAQFTVAQSVEDLPAQLIVRQSSSQDLSAELVSRHAGSQNLRGGFIAVPAGSQDLLGQFVVGQGHDDLVARFEVGQGAQVLACGFTVHPAGSEDLPAEFIVRQPASVDLLGELIVRQPAVEDLLGKLVVRQAAWQNLLGKLDIIRDTSQELLAEFIVRHEDLLDLPGQFIVGQGRDDLPAKFIVGMLFSDLRGEFIVRPVEDLPAKFSVRHPWPLWTNRYWLNGVTRLSEAEVSDSFLEEIITGVMDDIKTWLIGEEVSYSGWTNIDLTPRAIRRATTYGTVASLYARNIFGPQKEVIRVAPMDFKIFSTNEAAMEYWEAMMNRVLELYLAGAGLLRLWIDTIDEDPVFTMEDIPLYTWSPDDYTTR